MIPIDNNIKKQPPDLDSVGKEVPNRISSCRLSTIELELGGNEFPVLNAAYFQKNPHDLHPTDSRGNFTREISLQPREEEWMMDSEAIPETPQDNAMSYKEALNPHSSAGGGNKFAKEEMDDWDGNLPIRDDPVLKEGVMVKDTESGPEINFSEKENHGYWVAPFSSRDDYFFALEGRTMALKESLSHMTCSKAREMIWKRPPSEVLEILKQDSRGTRLPGLSPFCYQKKKT